MAQESEDLELIKMLALPAGAPVDERLRRWAQAFENWLHARRAGCHRTVELRSRLAWREFLALTHKPPWQAGLEDVEAYANSLRARRLRPYTISSRLTALSNFYAYCQRVGLDARCEPGFNPVKAAPRPKIVEYQKARSLSLKEETALLGAIQRDASPIGTRDYALILALIYTGWKSVRVRELRWGDLETPRLAAPLRVKVPAQVGEAIRDYLAAAGRLEDIRDEAYIFAPLRHPLLSESQDRAEDWDGGRPLSANHLRALVKQHAHQAGLKAGAITCHTLRHTGAMRRLEGGQSLDAVGACLGRTAKKANRAYLRRLQTSPRGRLKARRPGQPGQLPVRSRKPYRFPRRNHLRLTHGLWARYLPEFEWLAEQGIRLDAPDAAELRWRIVVRRANHLARHAGSLKEAARLLSALGMAAVRLARTLEARRKIEQMWWEIEAQVEPPEWWGDEEWPAEEG